MGKWADRLAEKTAVPLQAGTDRTDKRGVLSVLSVTPQGVEGIFSTTPATVAADFLHSDLAPDGKTEAERERFAWRMERLTRWGWPQADALELAERLTRRDRTDDDRVTCTDCHHYRPGRCGNHRRAGLTAADVGRDLAELLQHCEGFGLTKGRA